MCNLYLVLNINIYIYNIYVGSVVKLNYEILQNYIYVHIKTIIQSLQSRRSAMKNAIRAPNIGINFMELTSCGSGALGPLGFLECCTIFTDSLPSLIIVGSSSISISSWGCDSRSEYKSGNFGISKYNDKDIILLLM